MGHNTSIKKAIRRSLMEIVEGKNTTTTATPAERLEACRLLLKERALAQKGRPRGKPFPRKVRADASPTDRIAELTGGYSSH